MKIVATNRDLNFKYEIVEKLECGIVLKGTEVKSIRESKVNLKDSFALIRSGEVWLKNMFVSPYEHGNINNVNETRDRKLLLNRQEITALQSKLKQGGFALVPAKIYFIGPKVKVEIAVCRGKKLYDKRQTIKERDVKRKLSLVMKNN